MHGAVPRWRRNFVSDIRHRISSPGLCVLEEFIFRKAWVGFI